MNSILPSYSPQLTAYVSHMIRMYPLSVRSTLPPLLPVVISTSLVILIEKLSEKILSKLNFKSPEATSLLVGTTSILLFAQTFQVTLITLCLFTAYKIYQLMTLPKDLLPSYSAQIEQVEQKIDYESIIPTRELRFPNEPTEKDLLEYLKKQSGEMGQLNQRLHFLFEKNQLLEATVKRLESRIQSLEKDLQFPKSLGGAGSYSNRVAFNAGQRVASLRASLPPLS